MGSATMMVAAAVSGPPVAAITAASSMKGAARGSGCEITPILLLGTLGVSATGTLFGVMTVRTSARDLVLASVLFPLLSPVLLSSVAGTALVFGGGTFDELRDYLLLLAVFDVVAVAGGLAVFGALVDD